MKQGPKYEGKRGFLALIYVLILVTAIACIAVFFPRNYMPSYICLIAFFSVILLIYLFSLLKTYYVFTEDYLLVVSGFFKKKIFYRNIEEVKSVKNIFASLCLSYDRIKIVRGKSFFQRDYIAPVDKQEVIDELKIRAEKAHDLIKR